MSKYLKTAALLLLTAFSLRVNAQTSTSDEQAALAFMDAENAAFIARDADRFAALFAENADFISPNGNLLHGREAIRQAHIALFKMFPKLESATHVYLERKVRKIGPDDALVTAVWKDTATFDGRTQTKEMAFSLLLHRSNGQWLAEMATLTPVPDRSGQH